MTSNTDLPDLFCREDGSRLQARTEWPAQRERLLAELVEIEFGGLPPTPDKTVADNLHRHEVKTCGGATHHNLRVRTGPDLNFHFMLNLLSPPGDGPFPVIINGDGCWRCLTDDITADVLSRGYALATFNRVTIVPDDGRQERDNGLYLCYPGMTFSAIAAWAWGYHRCVDVLQSMPQIDASQMAITGHSRGGKTVLLAGATDTRIALTNANNSGAGGAGCYRRQGPDSETLRDIIKAFAFWFGPKLPAFIGREDELPFDQHVLKAAVAPRAYLSTEALGDLWANPAGTWQTHLAAAEVYRFLDCSDRLGIYYREGDHDHGRADWQVLLAFADWQFRQMPPTAYDFAPTPFPKLAPAHRWSAPDVS